MLYNTETNIEENCLNCVRDLFYICIGLVGTYGFIFNISERMMEGERSEKLCQLSQANFAFLFFWSFSIG